MANDQQSSFVAKNIKEFGVTDEGVDELVEALKTRRKHSDAFREYNKADRTIKGSLPLVEEPTRIRIGDFAEVSITLSTSERKAKGATTGVVRRKSIQYLTKDGFSDTNAN